MPIKQLTEQQKMAVEKNGNILVAAAAGSGKTAVLVERVINRLCSKESFVSADRLLIVTFTNAAAAEMRSRIEKRLDEECRKHPEDTALLLQKHLLSTAKICTIDSFCIDFVRENFDKLGISPDFTISDASVLRSVNQRVLDEILNEYFDSDNESFKDLLDIVGSEYDDGKLAELILGLYEYSRQLPFPDKWLDSLCMDYEEGRFTENNRWYRYAFSKAEATVSTLIKNLSNATDLLFSEQKFADKYLPSFIFAAEQLSSLKEAISVKDWDLCYEAISSFSIGSLPVVRGSNDLAEIRAAKDIYDDIKSKACDNLGKLFYAPKSFIDSQFKKLFDAVSLLTDIVKEFSRRVFEAYKEENTFTFHNTEALALQLLCDFNREEVIINPEAEEYLSLYDEVCVDEYQDTNDLQNMLFYVLSKYGEKLFAVGDVKQSIYGFRGANPEHFLKMKQNHILVEDAEDNDPKKIILSNNFRSEAPICEFINYFFELFMTKETGSIVYDEEEMLIASGEFPEVRKNAVSMDIIEAQSGDNKKLLEAKQIASFIKDKMSQGAIIPESGQALRNARYSDFAILLRSMKGNAGIIVDELRRQGIPVSYSGEGFCEFTEVALMLSLLKIISNPANDIELLTVMMSPIFGFSADEMADIRITAPKGDLYSAVCTCASSDNTKASDFLKTLQKFRLFAVTNTVSELINILYEETGLLNTVLAYSDGVKRRNNLLLLLEYSKSYASVSRGSINGFVEYILKQNEIGIKSAAATTGEDAVRIMSIHSSKGLQFPICIISGLSNSFNASEVREKNVYSAKFGIGFKYFDEADKRVYTTLSREAILSQIRQERQEEELRLFYVALTRAQNFLHFTAVTTNLSKKISAVNSMLLANDCKITGSVFSKASSYFEWLLTAVILHPTGGPLRKNTSNIICRDTHSAIEITVISGDDLFTETKAVEKTNDRINIKFLEEVRSNLGYTYPFEPLFSTQSKASVTALTNEAEDEKYNFSEKPSFMSDGGLTAAGKGTALHKVMEFYDFHNFRNPTEELLRLYEWQFISEDEKNAVDITALKTFFSSDIFSRILKSSNINREMRFMTELPATLVNPELTEAFSDEKILVQGAVDICFEEEDGIVILDFKTDRSDDPMAFAEAYSEQLSIYALACEKIFNKPVKEKIIYSFNLATQISI